MTSMASFLTATLNKWMFVKKVKTWKFGIDKFKSFLGGFVPGIIARC